MHIGGAQTEALASRGWSVCRGGLLLGPCWVTLPSFWDLLQHQAVCSLMTSRRNHSSLEVSYLLLGYVCSLLNRFYHCHHVIEEMVTTKARYEGKYVLH